MNYITTHTKKQKSQYHGDARGEVTGAPKSVFILRGHACFYKVVKIFQHGPKQFGIAAMFGERKELESKWKGKAPQRMERK